MTTTLLEAVFEMGPPPLPRHAPDAHARPPQQAKQTMRGMINTTTITATTIPANAPEARATELEAEALRLHSEEEPMVPPGQRLVVLDV